ncbi:MAG: gluconeogenesis factor YvcK family protein [Nanoarchaeota archaeon]
MKIVAIGGGTGLPTIVEGLRAYTDDITMIVTVTDSGRSSGILRKELDVLPPGDIRNCLIALSNSEKLLGDLFQYRFETGSLEGHNFGNLFLAALTKLTGSFEQTIAETSKLLQLKGKVMPSTFDNVHICAELMDGTIIAEENNIIDRKNSLVHLRSPIKKVFLRPTARANPAAVAEIQSADLIVLCPGSLFTSIISSLLVEGIGKAINNSKAKKVYISNIMTQVSQTHNYLASDHVKKIMEYLRGGLTHIVINTQLPDVRLLAEYAKEHASLVANDFDELEKLGVTIIAEDLLDTSHEKKLLWEKKDLLRHDSIKIARVLMTLMEKK